MIKADQNFMPGEEAAKRQLHRLTQLCLKYSVPGAKGLLGAPEFFPFGKVNNIFFGNGIGKTGTPFEGYAVVNGFLKESKPESAFAPGVPESVLDVMKQSRREVGNYADKIKNFTPDNWPTEAPPYTSAEGWEYEKAAKLKQLRTLALISWYSRQGTARHSLIANRLREIT